MCDLNRPATTLSIHTPVHDTNNPSGENIAEEYSKFWTTSKNSSGETAYECLSFTQKSKVILIFFIWVHLYH